MFKRIQRLLQGAANLSKTAFQAALSGSGTAALYLGTSTLLAVLLLVAYLIYAWDIDQQRWYRAMAVLQGIELDEIHQAEQRRAAEITYQMVLAERAERLRDNEFQQIRQMAFSQPPPQEAPQAEPPYIPNEAERISAFEERLRRERARVQTEGLAEQTQIIERMNPDQAKEVIRKLWQEAPQRVLQILMGMEERNRQKILYAMRESNDEELKDLCEILQRIGDGEPEASILKEAEKEPETPME